jgi:DNA polymerase-3 subunit chi
MTRITFYSNLNDKSQTLADLVQQALEKRNKMTILAESEQAASLVNRALWQGAASRFLPNVLVSQTHAAVTPVVIDWQEKTLFQDDILVNLGGQKLTNFSRFKRLVELVSNNEEDKAKARLRYKFYRDCGYDIQHIDQANLIN